MENDKSKFKIDFKVRLYKWTLRLVKFVANLPKSSANEVISKQLLRSGTSVIANYIEAGSASSRKDFIIFFTHSLKSANESKLWLTLLRDTDQGDKSRNEWLTNELTEISKTLASSIITLKRKV